MNDRYPASDSPLPRLFAKSRVARITARLYRVIITIRNTWYDRHPSRCFRSSLPVVSIGGLRVGGSGKTPATMLITDLLAKEGYTVAVASRGYKRKERKPVIVAPEQQVNWEETGDEPAMMRSAFPHLWLGIGAQRSFTIEQLQQRMGSRPIIVLDDGFQHRAVYRNLDIVCIHETLFEDRLLPVGFLREPVESLSRAHVAFIISSDEHNERSMKIQKQLSVQFSNLHCFVLNMEVDGWIDLHTGIKSDVLPVLSPVALCGIARPERFFNRIDRLGINCCLKKSFPDHYNFQEYDILSLRKLYSHGLITTEKDAIRLKRLLSLSAMNAWYLKMRLQFAENDSSKQFNHYIKGIIEK